MSWGAAVPAELSPPRKNLYPLPCSVHTLFHKQVLAGPGHPRGFPEPLGSIGVEYQSQRSHNMEFKRSCSLRRVTIFAFAWCFGVWQATQMLRSGAREASLVRSRAFEWKRVFLYLASKTQREMVPSQKSCRTDGNPLRFDGCRIEGEA